MTKLSRIRNNFLKLKKVNIKRTIEIIFLKFEKILESSTIISVFGILIYRINLLREMCKNVCIYITTWYVDINLHVIKNTYFLAEKIFRIIILVFLLFQFLNWLIKSGWDIWLKKQKGNNRFESSLFRYLQEKSIPHCFLVTGEWGSGKTYDVEHFFEKYYRYSKHKIYRISCFGLDSRTKLEKEIDKTIERNDNSLYTLMIKSMQFFPFIGEALVKFFKKSYGYDSVKNGSIFIFDDFERITSMGIVKENSLNLYEKSSFFLSNSIRGRNSISEFKEIDNEFDQVENSFHNIRNYFNYNLKKSDFDKYNVAIGLINDIVEIYGMKVIIVCNSDVLGEKFVHDIFSSKMNCIEYRKSVSREAKLSLIDECITNIVLVDDRKQKLINEYLNNVIKRNLNNELFECDFKNLRLFGNLIEAFMITADLFDEKDITMEFLNSLFNSIMITHYAFYKKSFDKLRNFPSGANIEFLLKLFYASSPNLIRLEGEKNDIRWVDITISGYWIFNLSKTDKCESIVETWKNYQFNITEDKLLNDYQQLKCAKKYNMLHVFFFFKQMIDKSNDKEKFDYKPYIDSALRHYDLSKIENVQSIVDSMSTIFNSRIHEDFFDYLFERLIQGHENDEIQGTTYIHKIYNEYRLKRFRK